MTAEVRTSPILHSPESLPRPQHPYFARITTDSSGVTVYDMTNYRTGLSQPVAPGVFEVVMAAPVGDGSEAAEYPTLEAKVYPKLPADQRNRRTLAQLIDTAVTVSTALGDPLLRREGDRKTRTWFGVYFERPQPDSELESSTVEPEEVRREEPIKARVEKVTPDVVTPDVPRRRLAAVPSPLIGADDPVLAEFRFDPQTGRYSRETGPLGVQPDSSQVAEPETVIVRHRNVVSLFTYDGATGRYTKSSLPK